MDKDRIHKVLEDNILLEDFSQLLIDEINNDDEILEKKLDNYLIFVLKMKMLMNSSLQFVVGVLILY